MTACAQRMTTCAQRISSVLGLRGTHARRVQNLCIACGSVLRHSHWRQKIKFGNVYISRSPNHYCRDHASEKPQVRGDPRNNQHHCSNHTGIIEKSIPQQRIVPRKVFYIDNILSGWFSMWRIFPHGRFLYRNSSPRGLFYIEKTFPLK